MGEPFATDSSLAASGADKFGHLACNYALAGKPVEDLCTLNAGVAERMGLFQAAQTWRVLRHLLCEAADDGHSTSEDPADAPDAETPAEDQDDKRFGSHHPLNIGGGAMAADEEEVAVDVGDAYLSELKEEAFEPKDLFPFDLSEEEEEEGEEAEAAAAAEARDMLSSFSDSAALTTAHMKPVPSIAEANAQAISIPELG